MNTKLFTFLALFSTLVYGQRHVQIDKARYQCLYELTHKPDTTNLTLKESENFTLQIGDSISVFMSLAEYQKDSLYRVKNIWNLSAGERMAIALNAPRSIFEYKILKNEQSQKIAYHEALTKTTYVYEESYKILKWKILPDTSTVGGYKCQKATTYLFGRNYTAWFAPSIPIQDGPYKFGGLPGMIIQMYDSKKHYNFMLVEFRKLKVQKPMFVDAKNFTTKTSKKQFNLLKKRFEESMFQSSSMDDNISFSIDGTPITAQEFERGVKKMIKLNPIEKN